MFSTKSSPNRAFFEVVVFLYIGFSLLAAVPQRPWLGNLIFSFEVLRSFPQFVLPGLALGILIGLLLISRKHWIVGLSFAAISLLGLCRYGSSWTFLLSKSESIEQSKSLGALTVAVANVEFGGAQAEVLRTSLKAESPDLIFLSEVTTPFLNRFGAKDEYAYRYELPGEIAEGCALYSRYPLEDQKTFAEPPRWFFAASAYVRLDSGARIRVLGVHAPPPIGDWQLASRNAFFETLAEEIEADPKTPLVILGDLNASPAADTYRSIVETYSLRNAAAGSGFTVTWFSKQLPFMRAFIDHILLRGGVSAERFAVLRQFGSDHFPIVARLRVEPL